MARPSAPRARATAPTGVPWHRIEPAPVVLVTGPEEFLADRAIRLLRDRMKAADPSIEVHDLDAGAYPPGELLTLASPSLFGEPRLIRIEHVEKATDAFLEEMLAYLPFPADDTVVVLRHAGGVRGKKLLDALRAPGAPVIEVACTELKGETDRADFVHQEFRAAARVITPGAVRALVLAFSNDLAELAAACRQLIEDTSDDVTEVTVDRYYGGRVETRAFDVADAAIAGRGGDALVLLRHLIEQGEEPVPIVAVFALKLRSMAKVVGLRGGGAELAGRLGLAPWQVDRARRDVQGWSDDGLANAIETIAATDAAVKGAGRDPVYALERMVLVIAARGE